MAGAHGDAVLHRRRVRRGVRRLLRDALSRVALTPEFFWNMAYLVIFASCVALVIQNVALAHVPPAQASLFLRLESVFGVLFSVLLYGEQVGLKLIVGFVLIFGAILVSEMLPLKRKDVATNQLEAVPVELP